MVDPAHEPSPSEYLGNFAGFIEAIRRRLETEYADAGSEALAEEAGFIAAKRWLVERWGSHFPCPVCENTEWTLSEVAPATRPATLHSFHVSCGYCGNTMQVVPGRAEQGEPIRATDQLKLPEQ